ncbi:MAG: hypothetical protein DDT32_01546 [Syntrophomonadaceae bacterium]|nr:hypothetical protein [Bacillota bacterium]
MSSRQIFPSGVRAKPAYEVSFLDTRRYIEIVKQKEIEHEWDIATEIYLARHLGVIHYADLMSDVPDGTASKSMLLAWLNDNTKHGDLRRPGLITLYQTEHIAHFPEGIWSARHFCEFAAYVATKLMDKTFAGAKKAALFKMSFRDPVWFAQAMGVCGAKLIEDCYRRGSLRSDFARSVLSVVLVYRSGFERIGAMIGRSTKNHKVPQELYAELKATVSLVSKHALAETINIQQAHWEENVFQKWYAAIESSVESIKQISTEAGGSIGQLPHS